MSAPFKVGEILVGQDFFRNPRRNGMECEVVGGLALHHWRCTTTGEIGKGMNYEVKWSDGSVTVQAPHQLRRRRPPAADSHERTFMADIHKLADKAPQKVGEPC